MNELEKIAKKYLNRDGFAITYSDFKKDEVDNIFQNMKSFERPDILSFYKDKILAIEHFEFDSYQNTSKGSNFKMQDTYIKQNMKNDKESWHHENITCTSNLKNYYSNFNKIFKSHVDNIPAYRKRIIKKFGDRKNIEFWFFVEDVTPLGNYYYRKKDFTIVPLLPFSKDFIQILKMHKEIKGIIFGRFNINKFELVLIKNDDKTIKKIESHDLFKVNEKDFLVFNTEIINYNI